VDRGEESPNQDVHVAEILLAAVNSVLELLVHETARSVG
jgi:hypothetical protein